MGPPASSAPQELERLRGELLALRERAGELAAIRDQLTQERRLSESLQQRLAGAQQQLLEARQDAASRQGGGLMAAAMHGHMLPGSAQPSVLVQSSPAHGARRICSIL